MTTEREFQNARRDYEQQCAEAGSRPPAPPPMQDFYFRRKSAELDASVTRADIRQSTRRQARALIAVGFVLTLFIFAVLARSFWRWA